MNNTHLTTPCLLPKNRYDSESHCVVLVESPPVFGANVLGVANECFYCKAANVAFVTNHNHDSITFVTIAHELGNCGGGGTVINQHVLCCFLI